MNISTKTRIRCSLEEAGSGNPFKPTFERDGGIATRSYSRHEINAAASKATEYMNDVVTVEKHLKESGNYIHAGTAAAAHQSFFRTSPESLELGKMAMIGIEATKALAKE